MADSTTRRSPLSAYRERLAALPIGATERPFLTQLNLRVDPDSAAAEAVARALDGPLPIAPCTATLIGDTNVLWLGPDEWLLLAPDDDREHLAGLMRKALGDTDGALTDVSAQRTTLRITGPLVREVLARGCAIDLHPRVAPAGTCVQTLLAQTGVILLVCDESASDLLVLVRASFAEYLADWLIDASTDLR